MSNREFKWISVMLPIVVLLGFMGTARADDGVDTSGYTFSHVTLSRACGLECPAYEITVSAKGEVRWVGESDVKELGVRTRTVSPVEVKKIPAALKAAKWGRWKAKYICFDDDKAAARLTIYWNGGSKAVEVECDAEGTPEEFWNICQLIEKIAGAGEWIRK